MSGRFYFLDLMFPASLRIHMATGQSVYGGEHSSSSEAVHGDSDIDYADVFGGPPRRSSMQVFRNSFAETVTSEASTENEERMEIRTSWNNLEEKPVFGHEASNLHRRASDGFYHDIFGGSEIYSSPRKSDRNSSSSSTVPNLLPASDPFASSPPSQFSLPAKLTKLESPSVASDGWSFNSESTGNRLSSDYQRPEETRSRSRSAYFPSQLSQSSEEPPDPRATLEAPKENNSMLHFSLYKWAGKGSPLLFSLKGATNGSKLFLKPSSKDHDNKQIDKDSSSSTHIIADEERQDSETSSKTRTEGSILNESKLASQKTEKPSRPNNSMSLRSFLDESDNIDINQTTTRKSKGEKTKTESSGENLLKNAVKGKIKGFAKLFDSARPQNNNQLRSQSLRWDRTPKFQTDNTAKVAGGEKQWASFNKAKIQPDASKLDMERTKENKTDKVVSEEVKTDSETMPSLNNSQSTFGQTENKKKPPESLKASHEDMDDILGDYFQVKELFSDEDKLLENKENLGDDNIQVLDTKIQQWAQGKEGNIRSLLSTLQFVLWSNSGWKPVALVDIIEANAVKRAYQKTLLYLHPDKLQQRDAPPHQHYIARKVFNLLQEAWEHFNTITQV